MTLSSEPNRLGALAVHFAHTQERGKELAVLTRLLTLTPERAEAWSDLGNLLAELRQYDRAYAAYDEAIRLRPAFAEAMSNYGNALMLTYAFDQAEAMLRKSIATKPDHALAHANLGDALLAQDRMAEALTAYREAIRLAPTNPYLHLHYANALFLDGDLRAGFAESEWRWRLRPVRHDPARCPLFGWRGEPLDGRTIRLYAEQGFGDAIQFSRYATLVAKRGGRVVLLVCRGLGRLLATVPGVATVEEFDPETLLVPGEDCDLSLMSLPALLGTDLSSVPAEIPYITAESTATDAWRARLSALPGLKVGLVWAGNPRPDSLDCALIDSRRSIPLAAFAPLAGMPGVSFVSLQKGASAAEARPDGLVLFDAMAKMTDFADTAALVQALDLVIAVDTSVAHLAGALGKPVWILSRHDGCWRWMRNREDSPWYPSVRLFRQTERGEWGKTIERVAVALRNRTRSVSGGFLADAKTQGS